MRVVPRVENMESNHAWSTTLTIASSPDKLPMDFSDYATCCQKWGGIAFLLRVTVSTVQREAGPVCSDNV